MHTYLSSYLSRNIWTLTEDFRGLEWYRLISYMIQVTTSTSFPFTTFHCQLIFLFFISRPTLFFYRYLFYLLNLNMHFTVQLIKYRFITLNISIYIFFLLVGSTSISSLNDSCVPYLFICKLNIIFWIE